MMWSKVTEPKYEMVIYWSDKVISNKEYTALIIFAASWVYFVGANTRFAPTIA